MNRGVCFFVSAEDKGEGQLRVAVYAAGRNGLWEIQLSLDLQVDWLWWSGGGGEGWNGRAADKLVLLSKSLPLGWAVKLRQYSLSVKETEEWTEVQWTAYVERKLSAEIKTEQEAGQEWRFGNGGQEAGREWLRVNHRVDIPPFNLPEQDELSRLNIHSCRLVELLGGRSLLQPEMEALLEEMEPGLSNHWPAAAQLAYLQGRLKFEAAVGEAERGTGGPTGRVGKAVKVSRTKSRPKEAGKVSKAGSKLAGLASLRLFPGAGGRQPARPAGLQALGALCTRTLRLAWRGAAVRRAPALRCLRCGSVATGRTACAACGLAGCAYCEACLALGRSRSCALLLRSAALPAVQCTAGISPTVAARRWGLSSAQAGAAGAALGFLAEPRQRSAAQGPERFLLWAVTGAGKTEITFPLLEAVLLAGGRALVATPRRDVVLELAPRLARAFPDVTLAVLYGGSSDRWVQSQMVLATTHQLLRFHQGFDLVIIDELDAFPYVNDPMLAFAAGQACKPDGRFIFLSATPPPELQRQAQSGKLPHARVPVRFHGQPLPVPRHLTMGPVQAYLKRGRLPGKLQQSLHISFKREAQIFVFVSRISHIDGLLSLLRRHFPDKAIEGTSSRDPTRSEKVAAFRQREISLLVTTTILERGVTVPRSDVFILDADSSLFDEASLVQMAGRAGRSKEDPCGSVFFLSPQWTRSQRGAISQIRTMNAIARRQGLIRKEGNV